MSRSFLYCNCTVLYLANVTRDGGLKISMLPKLFLHTTPSSITTGRLLQQSLVGLTLKTILSLLCIFEVNTLEGLPYNTRRWLPPTNHPTISWGHFWQIFTRSQWLMLTGSSESTRNPQCLNCSFERFMKIYIFHEIMRLCIYAR